MSSRIRRCLLPAACLAAVVTGCGGGAKPTKTTDTKHNTTSGAQSSHYHVGEHCQQSLAFAYSAQGLQCVNGKLRHKAKNATPKTRQHRGQTTTTAAPQGY